jgi:hypothetical protein
MKHWFDQNTKLMAEEEEGAEGTGDSTDEEEVEESGEETEEGDEEEEEDEEELSETELKESKALFKLLKDPATRTDVIAEMARRSGILKEVSADTTDKKIAKTALSVVDTLKESLGTEYAFLADKLGPGIEKLLKQERDALGERVSTTEAKHLENEIESIYLKLGKETRGEFGKFEKEITRLADKVMPAPGTTTEEYIRMLYSIASSGKGATNLKRNLADKINRNANDAAGRLASSGSGRGGAGAAPPKGATLRQIVEHVVKKNQG